MNFRLLMLGTIVGLSLLGCGQAKEPTPPAASEPARGPHGGRLLTKGSLSLELLIFEEGVAPEFRVWVFREGKPLPPRESSVKVALQRLGMPREVHTFLPSGDFLRGAAEVYEPHSFDVQVDLATGNEMAQWSFASHEGRVRIAAQVAQEAGIRTAAVAAGVISDEHDVQGLLIPAESRYARVVARFAGPVREVKAGVGDTVRAGQVLAVIESNTSLANYSLVAPIAGTVLVRNAVVGDLAGSGTPLFEIADLATLWVDLHIFGSDAEHIRAGLPVEVSRLSDGVAQSTRLDRVLPGAATASQSTVARATIRNTEGSWRPGAAVRARISVSQDPVALAVPLAALQGFRDWTVAFIRVGEDYEVRPLRLGRRDNRSVEVLDGLRAGDEVVVAQSYLIKADIEKSGASHDH